MFKLYLSGLLQVGGKISRVVDVEAETAALRLGKPITMPPSASPQSYRIIGDPRREKFAVIMGSRLRKGDFIVIEAYGKSGLFAYNWMLMIEEPVDPGQAIIFEKVTADFCADPTVEIPISCPQCDVDMSPHSNGTSMWCQRCGYIDIC